MMMKTNSEKLYLADNRTVTEDPEGIFIKIFEGSSLDLFQEVILKKSAQVAFEVEESSFVILLPVSGEMNFIRHHAHLSLNTEEVLIARMSAGEKFQIKNSYPDFRINYLHLQVKAPFQIIEDNAIILNFNLNAHINTLIPISHPDFPGILNLGKFQEGKEASYKTKTTGSSLFAYVLAGAFELDGKLLRPSDGLKLWDIDQVDIVALSNNSILVLKESFNGM